MAKPEYRWMIEPVRRKRIMMMICEEFGITENEMLNGGSQRLYARARMVFSHITRKHFGDTLQRIARELNADHTTIKRQLLVIDDLIFKNDPVKRRIEKLEKELLNKQLI